MPSGTRARPQGEAMVSEKPKIGRNEMYALAEIVQRQDSGFGRCFPYWFRKASMRKLAEHGFVVRHPANGGTEAQPAWLVTVEGVAAHKRGLT